MPVFDILVIGAGPGGHEAAIRSARLGLKTAIIEKQGWGGTCTHRGCIPTKALLACSRCYSELKKLGRMGVSVKNAAFDYAGMKRHQKQIVNVSALGAGKTLQDAGVEMKGGVGRIFSPSEVEWAAPDGRSERLSTRNVVIAWGSEPALPPDVHPSERILTSDGLLAMQALPESILIVGGNVIGVEFATFLAELGVRVTLIEMMNRLIPLEDEEASALLTRELKNLGVVIHTGMRLEAVADDHSKAQLSFLPEPFSMTDPHRQVHKNASSAGRRDKGLEGTGPAGIQNLSADYALICTGRKPHLHTEELNALGIGYDNRGIVVDEKQMTAVPGIFAIGDVTGGMMLAHRAMHQGKILVHNLYNDQSIPFREETVPSVIYTHPQVARVGLTEEDARRRGIVVQVHRADFGANITARTSIKGPGFVKILFDREKLVGATIAGDQAGELIAPLSLAMAAGLDRHQLEEWIIPHPALSELLRI